MYEYSNFRAQNSIKLEFRNTNWAILDAKIQVFLGKLQNEFWVIFKHCDNDAIKIGKVSKSRQFSLHFHIQNALDVVVTWKETSKRNDNHFEILPIFSKKCFYLLICELFSFHFISLNVFIFRIAWAYGLLTFLHNKLERKNT